MVLCWTSPAFSLIGPSEIWKQWCWDTSPGLWEGLFAQCRELTQSHWKSVAVIDDKSSFPKGAGSGAHLSNTWVSLSSAWLVSSKSAPDRVLSCFVLFLTNLGCSVMSQFLQSLFASSAAGPGQSTAANEAQQGLWVIRTLPKQCGIHFVSNLRNIISSARHPGQDPTPLILVICNLGV